MPRKLRRLIQIDRKLVETKKDDKIKEEKVNDFIIVHTEEEFNEKCNQNQNNVHYLIQDQNQFKWQKSYGPISTLKKYLIVNKECEESIDEEDIFHKNDDKVLIISADPGMGKSLILDHFTQNSSAENFFIKIILNTCTKTLLDKNFKERLQNKEGDLIEFVFKSLLGKTNEQEISLLKELAREEKLILMFDGLDEVNDYKEQVIQLIDALNRDCNLKKILITTRNHLREELEDHFNTFSFNLNNFDEEDQKTFLVKYWHNLNKTNQKNETKLMQSAEDLIKKIKSISSENLNQLIGIPLQTKMLADIFHERVKNKDDFSKLILENIAELYNEFIKSKIKIQYKKIGIEIENDEELYEEQKEKIYENHIKLSSSILFETCDKKEEKALTEKEEKRIIKYGIIVAFKNGIPLFLHQSFAEFLVAKSSLQKIKEQNKEDKELEQILSDERHFLIRTFAYFCLAKKSLQKSKKHNKRDKELEQILRDKRHFLIRRFLNDLMENHENQREEQEVSKKDEKEDFNKEIENCCRENLISLLKYFIQDVGANLKTENEFLIIASENGHKEIVAFLLQNGIDVNQQDKNGNTALMLASERGHKEIVQMLLQDENIKINLQDRLGGWSALMLASSRGHKEIVQMLLQDKNIEINLQDYYGETALMLASDHGHKEIVEMLLQDKNIQINQHYDFGLTPLMWASRNGLKEIVEMLLQDKNIQINQQNNDGYTALTWASRNGYKEIVAFLFQNGIDVNQQDKYEKTALMWASLNGHKEIVQMLLRDENIEINQLDKDGKTALMWASLKGHKEIVEILLQHKNIQINQQDEDGKTVLMFASEEGHVEIVEMLIQKNNIEINQQDKDGKTA
jgi:ankyrin repeat protein